VNLLKFLPYLQMQASKRAISLGDHISTRLVIIYLIDKSEKKGEIWGLKVSAGAYRKGGQLGVGSLVRRKW
jgi:hypothetical protein